MWWTYLVVPVAAIASSLLAKIIHDFLAGFTRGLELWPHSSKYGFMNSFYRFLHRVQGELWFLIWPAAFGIFILGVVLARIWKAFEAVAGIPARASIAGETLARKLNL
jgi:hypothetical protein